MFSSCDWIEFNLFSGGGYVHRAKVLGLLLRREQSGARCMRIITLEKGSRSEFPHR